METRLEKLQRDAIEHNICSEYLKKWENAKTKRQLMDIALSAQGSIFMCTSIQQGWGIESSWLRKNFEPYLNHRYIMEDAYSSCMYVSNKGIAVADTTMILLIDSDMTINVPQNMITKVLVCGKSKVKVNGTGRVIVVRYGEHIDVEFGDNLKSKKLIEGEYE